MYALATIALLLCPPPTLSGGDVTSEPVLLPLNFQYLSGCPRHLASAKRDLCSALFGRLQQIFTEKTSCKIDTDTFIMCFREEL